MRTIFRLKRFIKKQSNENLIYSNRDDCHDEQLRQGNHLSISSKGHSG